MPPFSMNLSLSGMAPLPFASSRLIVNVVQWNWPNILMRLDFLELIYSVVDEHLAPYKFIKIVFNFEFLTLLDSLIVEHFVGI